MKELFYRDMNAYTKTDLQKNEQKQSANQNRRNN